MIHENGLDNQFFLKGTSDNIADELKKASIFAFPSEFEGFSLALSEAMSLGLPAVGCVDCPSIDNLIKNNKNGLLTNSTPESFAEGLAMLMDSEELRYRMGSQAQNDMKAYDPLVIWDQWDQVIRKLIGKKFRSK